MKRIPAINSSHLRLDNSGYRLNIGLFEVLSPSCDRLRRDWRALGKVRGANLSARPNPNQWGVLFEHRATGQRVWFHLSPLQVYMLECGAEEVCLDTLKRSSTYTGLGNPNLQIA